jgi:hypothetical protein
VIVFHKGTCLLLINSILFERLCEITHLNYVATFNSEIHVLFGILYLTTLLVECLINACLVHLS